MKVTKDKSAETKESNVTLRRVVLGILFGGAVWVVLSVILSMIGPWPGGLGSIFLTPVEHHGFPSYSVAIFRSIYYLSMHWCVYGGVFLAIRSASLSRKASKAVKEEIHKGNITFVVTGLSSIIWLGVTLVLYLFKIDIGREGAYTGVGIAIGLGVILSIIIIWRHAIVNKLRSL